MLRASEGALLWLGSVQIERARRSSALLRVWGPFHSRWRRKGGLVPDPHLHVALGAPGAVEAHNGGMPSASASRGPLNHPKPCGGPKDYTQIRHTFGWFCWPFLGFGS